MNTLLIMLAILSVTGVMTAAVLGKWGQDDRWDYVPRGVIGTVLLLLVLLSVLN